MQQIKPWVLALALVALSMNLGFSQDKGIDTRIWSIQYWQQLAEKGLVEVAKPSPVPAAEFTGSGIKARSVLVDDSPDVPVTSNPNTTQSENSIFVNPLDNNKVLNSNNSTDAAPVGVLYGTSGFFSTDGGTTWGGSVQGTGGNNSGDPAAVIDLSGRYFVNYIAPGGGNGTAYSLDEGANWTHVQVAPNPGSLADKNHMWVDNSASSPFAGNLYAAWTDFGGADDAEIKISRSTDNGLSWSTSQNISSAINAGSHNQGVNIKTGPNGEVYAAWAVYDSWPSDETAIGFAKSTDGGATYSTASRVITNIRGIRTTETSKNHRVNSFPSMAVDISGGSRNGWIYIVWANIGVPGVNNGPDIDVYMSRSEDGGSSWSTPVRVNTDPTGQGKEHYFPWITCDPVTGALSVIFYDDRNVSSTQNEVFVANSIDGGNTWEDFKVSDVAFTPQPISGLAGGYMGDYIAIAAHGSKVYPCWTDNRSGQALAYVSPFTLADPTDPNPVQSASIYSDYTTPTSMLLSWTDPTNYTSGDTLLPGNFTIEIDRDGANIASVSSGVGNFTDTGLIDGTEYTYTLTVKDTVDSLSIPVNMSWVVGGAKIPEGPTNFFVTISTADSNDFVMHWTNPADNIDVTPMDDFAAINLYEDGSMVATFARTSADTGAADSAVYTPPSGTHQYWVTAVDNESPANESDPSNMGFSPIRLPFNDAFPTAGPPNPGFWINTNAEVTTLGVNPPSAPNVLNLNGDPSAGDMVALLPVDLSGAAGTGVILSFWYQPQGSGNAPETGDSLAVDFLNDLGQWRTVRNWPGTGVVPFVNEVISIDGENPGAGATYFHPGFQFRFRSLGTAGAFDDWLIDNVFLGEPNNDPIMAVAPLSLADTALVGEVKTRQIGVSNNNTLPSSLNFSIAVDPASPWLSLSATSGVVPSVSTEMIDVTLDASGLTAGTYSANLIVSGNDPVNPVDTVQVSFQVNDAPVVGFLPDSVFFNQAGNTVDSTTLTITNAGLGPLTFSLRDEDVLTKRLLKIRQRLNQKRYPDNYYGVELPKGAVDERRGSSPIEGLGGPDNFGHRWIDSDEPNGPVFNWIDITSNGTPITFSDDDFLEVSLPFTFTFYGIDHTLIKIGSNGYLTFGTDGTDYSNDAIPDPLDPNDFIAPFWDDLNPSLGGTVHYLATASEFIVQYTDIQHFGGGAPYTFQVILNANGSILYQYLSMQGDLTSATIGIEDPTAADGLEVVFNAPYIHDNMAIRIAAESAWLSENPVSGTVPANSTMDVQLIADATGLADGTYNAKVIIASNDPLSPEVEVPVSLQVGGGSAVIGVMPDSVMFDTTEVGQTASQSIYVHNMGTVNLSVSGIVSTNSDFSASPSTFSVAPGDSQAVTVDFTPSVVGDISGDLLIASNDAQLDTFTVYVAGVGNQPTGIGDSQLPLTYAVSPNYPNPFNPSTSIKYQVPEVTDVRLVVYNVLGQKIRTLVNESVQPGFYQAVWNGLDDAGAPVASGIYIYRFEAGSFLEVRKMILLK